MEVNGQLHAPAALCRLKCAYFIGLVHGCGLNFGEKENSRYTGRQSTRIAHATTPY